MTEYKKNDKGIWLPIDKNINKNHNDINWKKLKFSILKKLKLLSELLPLITVFSIVIGALSIYNYLKTINYDFLFSNIVGEPSSLIAIVIANFLFFLLLSIGFLSPFLLNILVHTESTKNDTYLILKIFHTLSISYIVFNFVGFIIAFFSELNFGYFIYFSSFCFFILAARACYILQTYYQVVTTEFFILSLLVVVPYCLYFSSSLYPIVQTVADKENFVWLVFIISHLLIVMNSFMAIFYAKSKHKNHISPIICIILVVFGYFHLIPYQNYEISLHKPKFIEKSQNSSWYILHNNNNSITTVNGMNEQDIAKYKQKFIPTSWAKFCQVDDFSKQNIINCEYLYDYTQDINPNTLYGYMAWNLGNTKVFCPQSVDFFDDKSNNKEKSEKCLVIDGKYLQLVGEYYLKQPINL